MFQINHQGPKVVQHEAVQLVANAFGFFTSDYSGAKQMVFDVLLQEFSGSAVNHHNVGSLLRLPNVYFRLCFEHEYSFIGRDAWQIHRDTCQTSSGALCNLQDYSSLLDMLYSRYHYGRITSNGMHLFPFKVVLINPHFD